MGQTGPPVGESTERTGQPGIQEACSHELSNEGPKIEDETADEEGAARPYESDSLESTDRLAYTEMVRSDNQDQGAAVIAQHRGERERLLLIAVLHRAVADLTGPPAIRATARRWLVSDSTEPYSFLWACIHLKLDAPVVRERLLNDSAEMLEVLER